MKIPYLAKKINQLAANYEIGSLPEIRKKIRGNKRLKSREIFTDQTIHDDWAFNLGGRSELQFNIGNEDEGIRYGIALSFQRSISMTDYTVLLPRVLKLNSIIRERPELFSTLVMWHWNHGGRSDIGPVREIEDELIDDSLFVFIGKCTPASELDLNDLMRMFDELLPIFVLVESENEEALARTEKEPDKFEFKPTKRALPKGHKRTRKQSTVNVEVRHSEIQNHLFTELQKEYGVGNVSLENLHNGNKIDVVVRTKDGYKFYEVKTASSALSCVRQALGQLMEYAFWPGFSHAEEIIIAGEHEATPKTAEYLAFLESEFNLPLKYKCVKIR